MARDNALLRERLRLLAEAAAPDRVGEVAATITLVFNGTLASLLRGDPGHAPCSASRLQPARSAG